MYFSEKSIYSNTAVSYLIVLSLFYNLRIILCSIITYYAQRYASKTGRPLSTYHFIIPNKIVYQHLRQKCSRQVDSTIPTLLQAEAYAAKLSQKQSRRLV